MNNQQDRKDWVDELNQATDRAWEHLGYMCLSVGIGGIGDRLEEVVKIKKRTIAYDKDLITQAGSSAGAELKDALKTAQDELARLNLLQKKVQTVTRTYDTLQVTETLADEGSTREKTLQTLHTTINDLLGDPEVQRVLNYDKAYAGFFSASKDCVDSMYDLRDVAESSRQLTIQNIASTEYLYRVNEIKSHMETIVKELNQARSTLANMDAVGQ